MLTHHCWLGMLVFLKRFSTCCVFVNKGGTILVMCILKHRLLHLCLKAENKYVYIKDIIVIIEMSVA